MRNFSLAREIAERLMALNMLDVPIETCEPVIQKAIDDCWLEHLKEREKASR